MTHLEILIPGRGGSRRIQDKNTQEVGGVPLYQWTLAAAAYFAYTTRWQGLVASTHVVVVTDTPEIQRAADTAGFEVVEPEAADQEDRRTVLELAPQIFMPRFAQRGATTNLGMVLYFTSPFRRWADVRLALRWLATNTQIPLVETVRQERALVITPEGVPSRQGSLRFLRTQDVVPYQILTGGFAVARAEHWAQAHTGDWEVPGAAYVSVEGPWALDIDTEWALREAQLWADCREQWWRETYEPTSAAQYS